MVYAYSQQNGHKMTVIGGTISYIDGDQIMVTTALVSQLPVCRRQIRSENFQGSSISVAVCFNARTWNFLVFYKLEQERI